MFEVEFLKQPAVAVAPQRPEQGVKVGPQAVHHKHDRHRHGTDGPDRSGWLERYVSSVRKHLRS